MASQHRFDVGQHIIYTSLFWGSGANIFSTEDTGLATCRMFPRQREKDASSEDQLGRIRRHGVRSGAGCTEVALGRLPRAYFDERMQFRHMKGPTFDMFSCRFEQY